MVLNWSDETKQGHPPTSHCFGRCQWFSCIKPWSQLPNLGTWTSEVSPLQESFIEQVCRFHGMDLCFLGGTYTTSLLLCNLLTGHACSGVMKASLSMNSATGNTSKRWGMVPKSPSRIWGNHSLKKEILLALPEPFLWLMIPPLVAWIPVICSYTLLIKFNQANAAAKRCKKLMWGQMNHLLKFMIETGKPPHSSSSWRKKAAKPGNC